MTRLLLQTLFSGSFGVLNLAETFYDENSTSASFNELANFLGWCRKKLGAEPYVIGGWAVYAYAKKQKSLDIDVVFEGKAIMKRTMDDYYKENGYVEEELHDQQRHFLKEISIGGQRIEIRFDAFSFADRNQLVENPKLELPWKLLKGNFSVTGINGTKAKLPKAELLLMLKVKAMRDRTYFLDARGIRIDPATRSRTKAKMLKDEQDIKDIIESTEIDKAKLAGLLEKTKFKPYFNDSMKAIAPEFRM